MRCASIDIGTNTILMLIGEIGGTSNLRPISDFYEVPRIGKSVSLTGRLDQASMDRALVVLKKYASIAREQDVENIFASATSAVRDANNRDEFIRHVKNETGISVEIIDGITEGRLVFLGAMSGAKQDSVPTLVVDIGGGSTELSYGAGTTPEQVLSINVGAVRLTERFFKHLPPLEIELEEAKALIEDAMKAYPFSKIHPRQVIAVGGTATTLALIAQGKFKFDIGSVEHFKLTTLELADIQRKLKPMRPEEILKLTEAAEGRADVLLAGTIILLKVLVASRAESFYSTDRGLRHGYLISRYNRLVGR